MPTTPMAKTTLARVPACGKVCTNGSRALAASAAVPMFVTPLAWSTLAVVIIMNQLPTCETTMPTAVSVRISRSVRRRVWCASA